MAARSVFKFLSRTCSHTFNSTYSTALSSIFVGKPQRKPQRSYSQPQKKVKNRENFFQSRKISKSLETLRDSRYKDEEEDYEVEEEKKTIRFNAFPVAADLSVRDPAREFKDKIAEERNEEGNTIYELSDGSRNEENYYDVLDYMRQMEKNRLKHLFSHLQPSNIKPYGSNNNHFPTETIRRPIKIVYPKTNQPMSSQLDEKRKKRIDDVQYKEFSSFRTERGITTTAKSNKPTTRTQSFSTSGANKKKASVKLDVPLKTAYSNTFVRKSSRGMLIEKFKDRKNMSNSNYADIMDHFQKRVNEYESKRQLRDKILKAETGNEQFLHRTRETPDKRRRNYDTFKTTEICEKPPVITTCDDYVTVKLGDLQEECRRQKRCKPKKISFGRLPKFDPMDCPCVEDIPLKEGKPLARLKKREIPERKIKCLQEELCTTPRADANYKITKKTLPVLHPGECPCEEREMTDFTIRRLPKKKIPEPPKICVECVGKECCPPRADKDLKVEKKVLPKLEINNCPCIEEEPLKSVGLKRLQPKPVKEPEIVCIEEKCDDVRADHGMKVEKKVLPIIKSECLCVEPPPPEDVPPLRRLKKIDIPEKPRPPCRVDVCTEEYRADKNLKIKQKKLPLFVPKTCPCVEEEVPDIMVKLKRLIPRNEPKEKEKVCVTEVCGARADDGLVVEPKELPALEAKPCPCVEVELVDVPPLKKLVPKPVKEPPKICDKVTVCDMPRSDSNLKVAAKKLPVLPPGSCPCIEPEPPIDVPPLKKLKKKPVTYKRVCPTEEKCQPRADENLKVRVKKLPKLEIVDCPCIEPAPPEDVKPLRRLKKMHVPEPCRVCPKTDDCEDIPRADENDWMYWKRVEVKSAECETVKPPNKRTFSSFSRRQYTTSTIPDYDIFKLKYDVANFPLNKFADKAYNVIIDIKPSAPLILTQKPYVQKKIKNLENRSDAKRLQRSRSEPIDCVKFIIYKSNNLGKSKSGVIKDGNETPLMFNTLNRFISTCSTLYEYSERSKENLKDHTTPSCECPIDDRHLQPKNPIIPEKETFITPYPTDELIDVSAKKGRLYYRTRKDDMKCTEEEEREFKEEDDKDLCETEEEAVKSQRSLSWWERIVNYFKARPGCPSPEEYKRMRLKEAAEVAAAKAGLCLYDPKEMLNKTEKELPKVITDGSIKSELQK